MKKDKFTAMLLLVTNLFVVSNPSSMAIDPKNEGAIYDTENVRKNKISPWKIAAISTGVGVPLIGTAIGLAIYISRKTNDNNKKDITNKSDLNISDQNQILPRQKENIDVDVDSQKGANPAVVSESPKTVINQISDDILPQKEVQDSQKKQVEPQLVNVTQSVLQKQVSVGNDGVRDFKNIPAKRKPQKRPDNDIDQENKSSEQQQVLQSTPKTQKETVVNPSDSMSQAKLNPSEHRSHGFGQDENLPFLLPPIEKYIETLNNRDHNNKLENLFDTPKYKEFIAKFRKMAYKTQTMGTSDGLLVRHGLPYFLASIYGDSVGAAVEFDPNWINGVNLKDGEKTLPLPDFNSPEGSVYGITDDSVLSVFTGLALKEIIEQNLSDAGKIAEVFFRYKVIAIEETWWGQIRAENQPRVEGRVFNNGGGFGGMMGEAVSKYYEDKKAKGTKDMSSKRNVVIQRPSCGNGAAMSNSALAAFINDPWELTVLADLHALTTQYHAASRILAVMVSLINLAARLGFSNPVNFVVYEFVKMFSLSPNKSTNSNYNDPNSDFGWKGLDSRGILLPMEKLAPLHYGFNSNGYAIGKETSQAVGIPAMIAANKGVSIFDAVRKVICLGGDTDTSASIAMPLVVAKDIDRAQIVNPENKDFAQHVGRFQREFPKLYDHLVKLEDFRHSLCMAGRVKFFRTPYKFLNII